MSGRGRQKSQKGGRGGRAKNSRIGPHQPNPQQQKQSKNPQTPLSQSPNTISQQNSSSSSSSSTSPLPSQNGFSIQLAQPPSPNNPLNNVPTGLLVTPTAKPIGVCSYHKAAMHYAPVVAMDDKTLTTAFAKHDIRVTKSTDPTITPSAHPIGRAARQVLTARAFGVLHNSGCDTIVSVFGAPRDFTIHDGIIREMTTRTANAARGNLAPVPEIRIARPILVSADTLRMSNNPLCYTSFHEAVQPKDKAKADALVWVDIHALGDLPFTPANVLEQLRATNKQHGIWIGHKFIGDFGVDNFESAWYRENGRVTYKADGIQSAYAAQDPLDWIWEGPDVYYDSVYNETLAWAHRESIVDMHSINFQVIPGEIKATYNVASPNKCATIETELTTPRDYVPEEWWDFLYDWTTPRSRKWLPFVFTQRKIVVVKKHFDAVKDHIAPRNRNENNFRSLVDYTVKLLSDDVELKVLRKAFPTVFENNAFNVAAAAFVAHAEDQAKTIGATARHVRQFFPKAAQLLKFMDAPPNPTQPNTFYAKLQKLATLVFALYMAVRMMKSLGPLFYIACVKIPGFALVLRLIKYILSLIPKPSAKMMSVLSVFGTVFYDEYQKDKTKAYLQHVVFAPVIEESLKHLPYVGIIFAFFFGAVEFHADKEIQHYFFHFAMHFAPILPATLFHAWWNWCAAQGVLAQVAAAAEAATKAAVGQSTMGSATISTFNRWKTEFYLTPWTLRPPVVDSEKCVSKFDAPDGFLPCQQSFVDQKPLRNDLTIKSDLELEIEPTPRSSYHFMPTQVPFYVPARSNLNLHAVVTQRLAVQPPQAPSLQMQSWTSVPIINLGTHLPILWENEVEAWIEHFKDLKKKRKYRTAYEKHKATGSGEIILSKISVKGFTKTNEALCRLTDDGHPRLRPRMVTDLPAKLQLRMGPELIESSARIKACWHYAADPISFLGKTIHLTYACGYTDEDLTKWAAKLAMRPDGTVSIIASGDDSLIVFHYAGGKMKIVEGDASMFDQSQGSGPLEYEYAILKQTGVSAECITLLRRTSCAPYFMNSCDRKNPGKMTVTLDGPTCMRVTGGPDTTLGNSCVMLAAGAFAAAFGYDQEIIRNRFIYLGFEMKLKFHENLEDATFLKGIFYPCKGAPYSHYWGKMPSQFLKLGKSYRDPRELYPKRSLENATQQFVSDLAHSYSSYLPVPILKAFTLLKYLPQERDLLEDHHIKPSNCLEFPPYAAFNWECLLRRYNLEINDFQEMEEQILNGPFTFIQHPGYSKMARADYC